MVLFTCVKIYRYRTPHDKGFLVFGVSNAKYLVYGVSNAKFLAFDTPDGNALTPTGNFS